MKKIIATVLAIGLAAGLAACSPSGSTENTTSSELSVNESDIGPVDETGNITASDNVLIGNDSPGNAGLDNATAGDENTVANGL